MNFNNPEVKISVTPSFQEESDLLQEKFNKLDEDTSACEACKVSPTEICEFHDFELKSLKKQEADLATRIKSSQQEKKPVISDDGFSFDSPYGETLGKNVKE